MIWVIRCQTRSYLKLALLGVQWKRIKDHWTNECYVSGLAVVDSLFGVYPQSRQFGQNINSFE